MVRALCLLAILAGCDGIFRLDKIGDRPPPDAPDVIDAPDASVPAGLAAWFEMEDLTSSTAIDSAGNHEGVCGTDQCPAVVAGKVGYAFAFDGTSKVIRAPSGGDLDIASDLTIAMWARVDETPSEFACAVNKLYGKNNGDSWQFCAYGPTSSWFLYVESTQIAGPPLDLGVWQHIAFTWNSSADQIRVYVNGSQYGPDYSATTIFDSGELQIGADHDSGADVWFFNGALDDLRIYKRVLTDTEIARLTH